ncbi:MAG: hypothetical protein M5U34_15280 [Chloroflexi bacterium]|nr:hypothetical protein [Chloroflexota bacterium]
MCAGVYIVRKLMPRPGGGRLTVPTLFLDKKAPYCFRHRLCLAVCDHAGVPIWLFQRHFRCRYVDAGEGEASALFVFAPGAGLALAFLYVIFLVLGVTPSIAVTDGRYPWLALLALIFINMMLAVMAVQWAAWVALQNFTGDILTGVVAFTLLALLFGPPRWLYLAKQPDMGGDPSSLALWAACAWLVIR